jgi:hypothetical protein
MTLHTKKTGMCFNHNDYWRTIKQTGVVQMIGKEREREREKVRERERERERIKNKITEKRTETSRTNAKQHDEVDSLIIFNS